MSERINEALDKQLRALAQLRTLKTLLENPNTPGLVSESHLGVLNAALDRLAESGEDVDEFRFPECRSEFELAIGEAMGNVVNRDLLYTRVASLLEYFAIRASVLETADEIKEEPARMIGFEPPKEQERR